MDDHAFFMGAVGESDSDVEILPDARVATPRPEWGKYVSVRTDFGTDLARYTMEVE